MEEKKEKIKGIDDSNMEKQLEMFSHKGDGKGYAGIEDNFFDYLKRIQKEKEEKKGKKSTRK